MDWNQVRAFEATAECGSLSSAARKLRLTQPTLSRQVAALEEALGVTLFERVGKRLVLTAPGVELLEHARTMRESADLMSLAASGRSQAVEGLVTISATDAIAVHVLPPILARIRSQAPLVTVEIVSSNAISDLRRREADIAIRHVRPEEPELIGKLIREAEAGFYASRDWVSRHGHPKRPEEVIGADFIGFDREGRFAEHLAALGLTISGSSFPVITENSLVAWELVRSGLGIGVMMREIASRSEELIEILEELPEIRFPVWLVTHRELNTSRRIRIVFDILAEGLAASGEEKEGKNGN